MLWTLKGPFDQKLEIVAHAGLQSVELAAEHLAWSDSQIEERSAWPAPSEVIAISVPNSARLLIAISPEYPIAIASERRFPSARNE